MKNMKSWVIILMVLVSTAGCGGWDKARVAKPVKDLREFLLPVPDATKYTHGNSDRTQVMWNILALIDTRKNEEINMKALRVEIDGLKKQMVEVSDPKNAIQYSEIYEIKLKALRAEIEGLKKQVVKVGDPNNAILYSAIKELKKEVMNSVPSVKEFKK